MNFFKRDFIVREPLLVGILVLITVAFSALTHAYSQAYDRQRAALGVDWFERGKRELGKNHAAVAIEDFRTALFYNARNWDYSMHLADALAQSGQTDQALNYYQNLWQTHPSSGQINLQLARLTAGKGDVNSAERYFNGAIFGDWPEHANENRRIASMELIHFYLDRGDSGHAESQLIILSENLPQNPELHTRVADLFSRVGDDRRALEQYRHAERLNPDYAPAIQGAGESAFRSGDFHAAQDYLQKVVRLDDSNTSAKKMLEIIQSIFQLNPYERGISETEKIRRTLRTFAIAGQRLQSCSGTSNSPSNTSMEPQLERWKQLQIMANSRFLTQHPEEVETLLEFSINSEKLAEPKCGAPSIDDEAVMAIARQRESQDR
ncbi:MAG TPA: tetratricopeptide repeat protein [Candidatus Acidoferrum sp.]|nr:tetratricopeptide repeat protein [Candidatus Acidoferrum sp.]